VRVKCLRGKIVGHAERRNNEERENVSEVKS